MAETKFTRLSLPPTKEDVVVIDPAMPEDFEPFTRRPALGRVGGHSLALLSRAARETKLVRTLLTASIDLVGGWAAAYTASAVVGAGTPNAILKGPIVVAMLLVIARCQRGSECLVHEGSHLNWIRGRRRLNDWLCDLLAASPVAMTVESFRESHRRHHLFFGTSRDPDFVRYRELGVELIDVSGGRRSTMVAAIRLLPRYMLGWLVAVGVRPRALLGAAAWQAAFFLIVAGVDDASVAAKSVGIWVLSFLLVLPLVRFFGEAEEHVYTRSGSVAEATISNIGAFDRLLIHPHADGYHVAHHLWPQIPHHALRRFHEVAVCIEPEGYGSSNVASRFRSTLPRTTTRRTR